MQDTAPENKGNTVQSLSGIWKAALDPANQGRRQAWFAAARPEAVAAPVPGVVDQAFPGATGVAWYWRTFRPERVAEGDERYQLRFGAAKYLAQVWVNGRFLGEHEGGETPFALDASPAIRPGGDNLLAVRVLNPTETPIDGLMLGQVPNSNRRAYSGIVLPVELAVVPAVRVGEIFARPRVDSGEVRVEIAARNDSGTPVGGRLGAAVGPAATGEIFADTALEIALPPGDSLHLLTLAIAHPRRWDLDDPFLYQVRVELKADGSRFTHALAVRCGFRDFRVERGYFRLNGRRVFLRSTHTGNHYPIGHLVPHTPDLGWRDLLYAKASGFNMVRFIASTAAPEQLDYCDQLGLMVYEESAASWGLGDSPRLAEHFDRTVAEIVRRDRNHPSVTVWGLLNETPDGPVFRHAAGMLPLIRSLDPSRLVLLSSGRHDAQPRIGSLCNPDHLEWEYQWGGEGPQALSAGVEMAQCSGYADQLGDVHVYLASPHPPHRIRFVRELGRDSRPVFLSEYGVNSLLDVVGGTRLYEQSGNRPDLPEAALFRSILDRLETDWRRLGMEATYPFLRDMLRDSQRRHCRQRLVGLDMIRSNPKICGHNITGMLDHGVTGEGLWTFWREWKPGIVDALTDGWAPLRWCLFAEPGHGYVGRPVRLEAVLANEDVLKPGRYPVCFRLHGPEGTVWEKRTEAAIPDTGEDGPLALPVLAEEVVVDGPAGEYLFAAEIERGGGPAGGRLRFRLADPAILPARRQTVSLWGVAKPAAAWLRGRGLRCRNFGEGGDGRPGTILVGVPAAGESTPAAWRSLAESMVRGSAVLFLSPHAFRQGEIPLFWLPLSRKGKCEKTPDYNYIKECVARPHPFFAGLQGNGIMDWDYYGPLLSPYLYEGQETPDEVAAAGFIVGHANYADRYTAGVVLGTYRCGAGSFVVNTLNLLDHLDSHPAADRLLLNLLAWAGEKTARPRAGLPADFAAWLAAIGYA
jgi:beta-galactosidase